MLQVAGIWSQESELPSRQSGFGCTQVGALLPSAPTLLAVAFLACYLVKRAALPATVVRHLEVGPGAWPAAYLLAGDLPCSLIVPQLYLHQHLPATVVRRHPEVGLGVWPTACLLAGDQDHVPGSSTPSLTRDINMLEADRPSSQVVTRCRHTIAKHRSSMLLRTVFRGSPPARRPVPPDGCCAGAVGVHAASLWNAFECVSG